MQTKVSTPTTLGGRYSLVRHIGTGGMGVVWEAEDRLLHRRVAVKALASALCDNEAVAARFRREALAAGRVAHPNIAQVLDYGQDDGCPYIVLELAPGSTLRRVLEERGPLPPHEVAAIGAQIADALATAHAAGIVHRDVKPGNVMVGPDGRVKVMDFGIADAAWFEPLTDTGTIMATAKYVSPEQATGAGASGASDVYALGAVLYEMFAGRLPFEGDSPIAIAHAHAYDAPRPLAHVAPGVPGAMRAAVEAAMRKDPRERPSAAGLAAALRAASVSAATHPALVPKPPTDRIRTRESTAPLGGVGTPIAAASAPPALSESPRGVVWALAALAVLALLAALAFALLSAPGDRHARDDAPTSRRTPQQTQTVSDTPAAAAGVGEQGGHVGHGNEGNGNAFGHDAGSGPGDEGHGNDG